MDLFDRVLGAIGLERKDNPVGALITSSVSSGNGQPYKSPRNYNLYAQAYGANPYLYRAISYIADACAGISWSVYADETKKKKFDTHPGLDILRTPNPQTRQSALIKQMVSFYYIAGNSYLTTAGPKNGLPKELWTLRPDRMTIVPGKSLVDSYIYRVGNNEKVFPAEVIMQWRAFNPFDDFLGLSPVAVAATIVDSMEAGEDWNLALKQNSGKPSGAIVSKGQLSPQALAQIKKEIARTYSSARNAGRPLVLQGDVDWKQFSLSPMDVDWLNDKRQHSKEIALIIGVPPELLGDSANKTYSNYGEARKSFLMETALPTMDTLREELNAFLGARFDCYYDYNKDDIEALQDNRDSLVTRVTTVWNAGLLSHGEARKELGYDVDKEVEMLYNTKNVILEDAEKINTEPEPPQILPPPPATVPGNKPQASGAQGGNPAADAPKQPAAGDQTEGDKSVENLLFSKVINEVKTITKGIVQ